MAYLPSIVAVIGICSAVGFGLVFTGNPHCLWGLLALLIAGLMVPYQCNCGLDLDDDYEEDDEEEDDDDGEDDDEDDSPIPPPFSKKLREPAFSNN